MLFWKINRKWWNRNWTANTLIKNSEVEDYREIVFNIDRKKTLVSWPRSLTLLLALFVNDVTSICMVSIISRAKTMVTWPRRLTLMLAVFVKYVKSIFPSCYIYLPISIQYFQSHNNNGDLAKKFDFAAGSFHPISWSCLCHSRSLDHAQVFLPLVLARQTRNITAFCDKKGAHI